tara:strand:- start:335 stop:1012 length:678 start_codon:yes stop_codon:yes gene_type:complete
MRIKSDNRTIVNIVGGPLIIFSILFNQITFSILIFTILFFSLYEYNSLIESKSKLNFYKLLLGIIWTSLILCFLPIYNIENAGKFFVLIIFSSVWVTDSMAFIMGKSFGKKKIFPSVSPNKTWVGSISGLIFSILFVLAIKYSVKDINIWPKQFNIFDVVYIGFIAGFFGQFGDFLESYFKRRLNVKDSSRLLLGHGGFLDRFDSMFIVGGICHLYLLLNGFYNG